MAFSAIETVTQLESKIISLARYQYNCGDRGGTFTPGFVRKETGQGYDAINFALSSLVGYGLLEKSRTTGFRQGAPIEIELYRITERGLQAFERIEKEIIKIEDRQLPGNYQGNQSNERGVQHGARGQGHSPGLHQSVKRLEATLGEVSVKLGKLHDKLDGMLGIAPTKTSVEPTQATATKPPEPSKTENEPPAPPKARKTRASSSSLVLRRLALIEAVKDLWKERKVLLAEDVKDGYIKKCKEKGITPKGAEQFSVFLNGFKANRLISLKRMGCKAIGIEGRGSRLVIEMTREGEEYLVKNATASS
jgi:DNA-binding PadR family transcriptional regulator